MTRIMKHDFPTSGNNSSGVQTVHYIFSDLYSLYFTNHSFYYSTICILTKIPTKNEMSISHGLELSESGAEIKLMGE